MLNMHHSLDLHFLDLLDLDLIFFKVVIIPYLLDL